MVFVRYYTYNNIPGDFLTSIQTGSQMIRAKMDLALEVSKAALKELAKVGFDPRAGGVQLRAGGVLNSPDSKLWNHSVTHDGGVLPGRWLDKIEEQALVVQARRDVAIQIGRDGHTDRI